MLGLNEKWKLNSWIFVSALFAAVFGETPVQQPHFYNASPYEQYSRQQSSTNLFLVAISESEAAIDEFCELSVSTGFGQVSLLSDPYAP